MLYKELDGTPFFRIKYDKGGEDCEVVFYHEGITTLDVVRMLITLRR